MNLQKIGLGFRFEELKEFLHCYFGTLITDEFKLF